MCHQGTTASTALRSAAWVIHNRVGITRERAAAFNVNFPRYAMTDLRPQPGFGSIYPCWGFQKSSTDDLDRLMNYVLTQLNPAHTSAIVAEMQRVNDVPNIRDSFVAGRDFDSLPQMQGAALRWCTEIYGRHKHRGIDGQTPASLLSAVERAALMPLPPRPFEVVTYTLGKVAPDCHVQPSARNNRLNPFSRAHSTFSPGDGVD